MRNVTTAWTHTLAGVLVLILGASLMLGCEPTSGNRVGLDAGYRALEAQHYEQAIGQADAYLASTAHGPGSAEALYLRGRGLEGRVAPDQSSANANLQAARVAYIQALESKPSPQLEAYIRTSLANVAYFQHDYTTAIQQWAIAYEKLDRDDVKCWVLYRIAISQQRLGHFNRADQTFAQVQQRYPNTVPAQRARAIQGARAFYVQLATFVSSSTADNAAANLRRQGVTPVRMTDSQGRHLLRVGPVTSYPQALALRSRFLSTYPDAMIVP